MRTITPYLFALAVVGAGVAGLPYVIYELNAASPVRSVLAASQSDGLPESTTLAPPDRGEVDVAGGTWQIGDTPLQGLPETNCGVLVPCSGVVTTSSVDPNVAASEADELKTCPFGWDRANVGALLDRIVERSTTAGARLYSADGQTLETLARCFKEPLAERASVSP